MTRPVCRPAPSHQPSNGPLTRGCARRSDTVAKTSAIPSVAISPALEWHAWAQPVQGDFSPARSRAGVENYSDAPGAATGLPRTTSAIPRRAHRSRHCSIDTLPATTALSSLKGRSSWPSRRRNQFPSGHQLRRPAERDERVSNRTDEQLSADLEPQRLRRLTRRLQDAPADAHERGSGRRNVRHRTAAEQVSVADDALAPHRHVDGRCDRGPRNSLRSA